MVKKTKKASKGKSADKRDTKQSLPISVGTRITTQKKAPSMSYKNDGSCTVAHTEYVSDINTNDGSLNFAVNPQRNSTFTWLSAVATRFEMFRFKKLRFRYEPSSGTYNDGYVVLGFDFDFYDPEPTKATMLAWKYSAKAPLWDRCAVDVSTDSRLSTMRYCQFSSEQGDARLDMLGKLWVLVVGPGANFVAGEVFVDYEVEFRQPSYKLPPALFTKITGPSGQDPTSPFSSTPTGQIIGNILATIVGDNDIRIEDVGQYLLSIVQNGPGITTPLYATFSEPKPSSEFTATNISLAHASNVATGQWLLNVKEAPVNIAFGNATGDAGAQQFTARLATYEKALG